MDASFWTGFALIILGFCLLIYEVCVEPELVKRPLPLQVTIIALCFATLTATIFDLVNANVPLEQACYVPPGEYSAGTVISGISWDPRLTELRVGLTNPTDDDYHLDLTITPDKWVYKAVLTDDSSGCRLKSVGGNTIGVSTNTKGGATKVEANRIGDELEFYDNTGDLFTTLLTDGGYRLICDNLPPHFSVKMIFALGSTSDLLEGLMPSSATPGTTHMGIAEIAGAKSALDMLGTKPTPSRVKVSGRCRRARQPFSIKSVCQVSLL